MGSGKKVLLVEINSINPPEKYMQYAVKLARNLNMGVHFVHVFNPDFYPVSLSYNSGGEMIYPAENMAYVTEVITKNYRLAEEKIKSEFNDSAIQISSEIGVSYHIMKKLSSEENVGMIMIQGNSASSELTYLTDEVTGIIENTKSPVWIIPIDLDYKPINRIVYTTGYNEADVVTLNKTVNVAKAYSSEIIIVHFTENIDFKENINAIGFEKIIREKTGYNKIKFEIIKTTGSNFSLSLNNFLLSANADLLVMLKEKTNLLKKIFSESFIKSTLKRAQLPMLIFQERQEFLI